MFCPQCGTKTITSAQRFCRECGAEIGPETGTGSQRAGGPTPEPANGAPGASSSVPPLQRPFLLTRVIEKDNTMKTLLMAGLLVLALPFILGALLASVVAGVALMAVAIKLAPIVALGIVIYWVVTGRRRQLPHGR